MKDKIWCERKDPKMADKITDNKVEDKCFERSENVDKLIKENGLCKRRNKKRKEKWRVKKQEAVSEIKE